MVARAGRVGGLRLAYQAHSREALYPGTATPTRLLVEMRYPSGAGAVATATRIDGDAARLVADGFGASPPRDDAAVPVAVVTCGVDEKRTDCRCASFSDCRSRPVGGQDVKLVCRDATPDDGCSARRQGCFAAECILDDWNRDGTRLIACGGDSNTYDSTTERRWCRRMASWLDDFQSRLAAWPGTRAADDPGRVLGSRVSSHVYLNILLRRQPRPDIVILAWGTNDLFVHSAEEIVTAIDALVQWMRREHVVPVVATVPWLYDETHVNVRVAAVNAALRARYGPCLIDFTSITPATSTWYLARRHLNVAGQDRRALAALYTLGTMPRSCADGVAPPR